MNDDLISRKAAIDALTDNKEMINAVLDSLTLDYNTRRNQEQRRGQINDDIETIKELPSAQPERKKGRWIVIVKGCKLTSYKCSECGRYIADDTGYDVKKDYPFCHCGADMREDADE